MKKFTSLKNSNSFTEKLPADISETNIPRQVYHAAYSNVKTHIPSKPELIHYSPQFLKELKIEIEDFDYFLEVMSGTEQIPNAKSYAMCYGGHQFGSWAGQLGDGRAINIAELELNSDNWKFQLKGSGPTPYSRGADGFAVLRSSIREYLCSEAMHNLGIPTTRALSLVKTGDLVNRDMLYDGNPKDEQGAIVCRVSKSFLRFGSFEIFAARRDHKMLKKMVDYTINEHYSHLGSPSKSTYIHFFQEVAQLSMKMVLEWQRVGFVHGVMNTDNMSILGLTIDYGPYGWVDNYDPDWTPNTTDSQNRRYRFGNQPSIVLWNLVQLANALYPLIEDTEALEQVIVSFKKDYKAAYHAMMLKKLGLSNQNISEGFIEGLTHLLALNEIDMTIFYRELSEMVETDFDCFWEIVTKSSYLQLDQLKKSKWFDWFTEYKKHLESESVSIKLRLEQMRLINPKFVLRNYMVQLAIEKAENGDYSVIDELYHLMLKPYDNQEEMENWYAKRPDWAKHKIGCSMLSCSS